jgi:hypothetical protein
MNGDVKRECSTGEERIDAKPKTVRAQGIWNVYLHFTMQGRGKSGGN